MSPTIRQSICRQGVSIKHQSGQTMVFAMVFIVVILIGVIILFNTGQLTRHKMEVQNAADAAAYSAAILTARELNFMAYTNRAMVANQVTLGQFAAFESWGRKYKMTQDPTVSGYLAINVMLLPLGPYQQTAYNVIKAFLKGMGKLGNTVNSGIAGVMGIFGKVANIYIPGLQKLYALHQQTLRLATLATQLETIPKIIDDNAKGAKLSNFGAIAAILSGVAQNAPGLPFSFTKMGSGDDEQRRFAAFVNDGRGDWTRDRERDPGLGITKDIDFTIPIVVPPLLPLVLYMDTTFDIGFFMGFGNVQGGTELRYLGSSNNKPKFGWSSMDTVEGRFLAELQLTLCPELLFGSAGCIQLPNLALDTVALGIPLSFGGYAYENVDRRATTSEKLGSNVPKWKRGNYGDGKVWSKTPVAGAELFARNSFDNKQTYKGLPYYMDVNKDLYPQGTDKAPTFLVGVRKNGDELRTSDELNIGNSDGKIGATTRLAGGTQNFGDTTEGQPTTLVSRWINEMSSNFRDQLTNAIVANVNACNLPIPMANSFCNQALSRATQEVDFVDKAVQNFTTMLTDKLRVFENMVGKVTGIDGPEKGGVYALAAAEVYFKNPKESAPDNKKQGNTFSPYWQVRLKPVDDDIRRWSVISQGIPNLASPPVNLFQPVDSDTHLKALKPLGVN